MLPSKRTLLRAVAVPAALLVAALVVFAGSGAAAPARKPKPAPKPTNTSPPTIAGTPQVGQTLTANPGSWTSAARVSVASLRLLGWPLQEHRRSWRPDLHSDDSRR